MHASFNDKDGQPSFPFPAGVPGALWDAIDQARTAFSRPPQPRMGRGDVRAAVLALLQEQPMHGYQIIQEIDQRSGGAWKPSAGSVYPTLQLLADEGLIDATESNGRKTYALTEAGSAAAAEADGDLPWENAGRREGRRSGALPKAGAELAQAVAQVLHTGTPEQVSAAVTLLEDTRRGIYGILAKE